MTENINENGEIFMTMKALIVEDINAIALKEVEIPPLKPDEILVKVVYAGVCGTDLAIFSGETSFVKEGLIKYPARIGHEWSGTVANIGAKVTKFKAGDRVVSDNAITCRECEACKSGNMAGCSNMKCVGTINCWDGSFAEYIIIPECHLHQLPDTISLKTAALIEPISIALGGTNKRKIDIETTVVIIGTGPIGLAAVALAKNAGAKSVIIIGRTTSKLDIALQVGASAVVNTSEKDAIKAVLELTNNHGADFIIETSGAKETIQLAIDIAAERGTISLIGFYETNIDGLVIDRFVMKQASLVGVMGEFGFVPAVIEIMEITDLHLEHIITQIVSFDGAVEFFNNAKATAKQRIKTLVKIAEE